MHIFCPNDTGKGLRIYSADLTSRRSGPAPFFAPLDLPENFITDHQQPSDATDRICQYAEQSYQTAYTSDVYAVCSVVATGSKRVHANIVNVALTVCDV